MHVILLSQATPGAFCGSLVCPLLALAVIIKCVQTMRKAECNWTCAISLILAFAALAILPVISLFSEQNPPNIQALIGTVVAYWLLLVAALVTAIVGLVQCSLRKDLYRFGRGSAIWSLVITSSLMLIGIGGLIYRTYSAGPGQIGLPQVSNNGTKLRVFQDLNFRMEALPAGWSDLDVSKLNEDASVGYIRRNPDIFFMIVAEKLGVETGMTSEALASMAQSVIRSAAAHATFTEPRPARAGGVDGLVFETTATVHAQKIAYSHWVAAHNGYGYQLLAWGGERNAGAVRREAGVVRSRFSLIDPERSFFAKSTSATNIERPSLGYRIDLADSGWHEMPELLDVPDSSVIALGETVYLIVRPLRLEGIDPPQADIEALLLPDERVAAQDWTRTDDTEFGGLSGRLFEWKSLSEGIPVNFRGRILRGEHFAYAVTGWGLETYQSLEVVDSILPRIKLLDQPASGDDLTDEEREQQAAHMLQLRQIAQQRQDWPAALQYTQQAWRLAPDHIDVLNMLAWAYEDVGRHDQALALLDEHVERLERDPRIEANRAFQLARLGRENEAVALYAAQFGRGLRDDAYFEDYLEQLQALERYDEALEALAGNEHYKTRQARGLRRAELLRARGDFEEALAIYRGLQSGDRPDPVMAVRIADTHFDAGAYVRARAACEAQIAGGAPNAYVHFLLGRCELELDRYPQARDAFEAALELDPTDAAAESYLEYVAGLLGQGDNSMLRKALAPVELPPEIAAAIERARTATDEVEGGSLLEADLTAIAWEPGTALRTTHYRTIQILTDDGVADWSTLVFDFDPLGEDIFVNWVRVFDLDDNLLAEGNLRDYYALDSAGLEASQDKRVHVPIPGVRAGVRIDVAVTRESRPGPDRWLFREEIFAAGTMTRFRGLLVRGPLDQLRSEAHPQLTQKDGDDWRAWVQHDLDVFEWEPFRATYDLWVPTVAVADARDTWVAVGDEYLRSIADRLQPDPEIAETAREVAGDISDAAERMRALAAHVQRSLTYKAIEFGVRARQPHTAAVTLRNRYGDCKDHAVLLQGLLSAAGVDAWLALMNTSEVVRPGMPSLDQFNHMVVAVRDGGGYRMLDCTNKTAPPGNPLVTLSSEQFLILREGASAIHQTEPYPDDVAGVEVERTIALADNLRDFEVRETVRPRGAYADALRSAFRGSTPREVRETAQAYLSDDRGLELISADPENADQLERPFVLRLEYRVRDRMHRSDNRLRGDLPLPWARAFFSPRRSTEERVAPLQFNVSAVLATTTRLQLPPRVSVASEGGRAAPVDTEILRCSVELSDVDGVPVRSATLQRRSGLYAPDRYAGYQDANQRALDLLAGPLLLDVAD